jgi:hypothetical protein
MVAQVRTGMKIIPEIVVGELVEEAVPDVGILSVVEAALEGDTGRVTIDFFIFIG